MAIINAAPALDASLLPSKSSSDLVVVPVTPQEYEQTWLLNEVEWKGPLTQAQYLERERFLIKQDLTKDNGITGWMLTSSKLPSYPNATRPILAACETIRKQAYLAKNGKVETIQAHGVCSVFTRPDYRGRGYAGRMMAELGKELERMEEGQASFSILFSDIGQQFYANHGWAAFPSTHIRLDRIEGEQYQIAKSRLPAVRDLTRDGLKQLPVEQYLEGALKDISLKYHDQPCVAVRPDMPHFDWHHAREEVQAQLLGLPFPHIKGAIHEETGVAIIWGRVYASKPQDWSLHILHVAMPPALRKNPTEEARNALSALLLRAQHEAHTWNMADGAQVWDPSELTISAAQSLRSEEQGKVEIIRRDKDHICSLRWLGDSSSNQTAKDVVWVNLEKYTWC